MRSRSPPVRAASCAQRTTGVDVDRSLRNAERCTRHWHLSPRFALDALVQESSWDRLTAALPLTRLARTRFAAWSRRLRWATFYQRYLRWWADSSWPSLNIGLISINLAARIFQVWLPFVSACSPACARPGCRRSEGGHGSGEAPRRAAGFPISRSQLNDG